MPSICRRCLLLFFLSLFTLYGTPAQGQHFTNCLATTSNATVLVPADVTSTLQGGDSLTTGDEIALFTNDGACAGSGQWNESNLAIAVAGANSQESEGYEPSEPLKFKVWDASASATYSVDVTYQSCTPDAPLCRDDGRYETDAVFELVSLTADTEPDTADLSMETPTPSVRLGVDQEISFHFILSNSGPDAASGIEVSAAVPPRLTRVATSATRGTFDDSTGVWSMGGLAPNSSDTLTVTASANEPGTFSFSAEVSASTLPDPDSTPDNSVADEDDQSTVTITVDRDVECRPSSMEWEKMDSPPTAPSAIAVIITNPDGLVGVDFVDAEDRPALQNLTAASSSDAFTSTDGIHWRKEAGAGAPTTIEFTLTQADRSTLQAQFEAEALSVCPAPDPLVTDFDPSPTFAFEEGSLAVTLSGNVPNPFHQQTSIHFTITAAAEVTLTVYNVLGQRVATLLNREMPAGPHTVSWDGRTDRGRSIASGLYLYRLQVNDRIKTARMNVIR